MRMTGRVSLVSAMLLSGLAQTVQAEAYDLRPYIGLSFGNQFKIGEAQNSNTGEIKDVTLGPNSGVALGGVIRNHIDQTFATDMGVSYHMANEEPTVEDANGEITRMQFSASAIGKFIKGESSTFYAGLGLDYHMGPSMSVSGFADVEVEYEDALGYHAMIGMDWVPPHNRFSIAFELRFNTVTYTAKSMKLNGSYYSNITAPDGTALDELNGDGVDLRVGFVFPY